MIEINKTITLKLIFLISILALTSAFFIEYVLGHQPCNLCILERIPYLFALIIILLNYKFGKLFTDYMEKHGSKWFTIIGIIIVIIFIIIYLFFKFND